MGRNLLFSAIFAAIICVFGFLYIPLPGIQSGIVLQNMMCVLAAALLGGATGAAPAALFLAAGVLGLPVFSGGMGGFHVLTNINGGFKIGYALGALMAGLIAGKPRAEERKILPGTAVRISVAMLAGMLAIYLPEIFYVLAFNAEKLGADGALKLFFAAFFVPFLPADFAKAVAGTLLALKVRPAVAQYLHS